MRRVSAYLLEDLDLRLRLRCTVRVVAPPIDEGLEVLAVIHLCLVLLSKVPVTLGFGGVELREVAARRYVKGAVCLEKQRPTPCSSPVGMSACERCR